MNRLQKKCLIASAATHGSLLTLLFVGPAFFSRDDNAKPTQILTMISSRVVDDAPSSDASSTPHPSQPAPAPAPAPPPEPAVAPVPTPQVQPHPAPPQVVTPTPPEIPKLEKKGDDEFKRVKPTPTPPTKDFTPVATPPKTSKPKVKPTDNSAADAEAEAQKIIANRLAKRINQLNSSLASENSAQISPGADRGEAVSNYRDIVYSMYTAAWQPPSSITDDTATVTARVTIARDGRVTGHEILKSSGNAAMDKSIENTLSTVTFIQEFPAGAKDLERSYSIKFDISAKRSLE